MVSGNIFVFRLTNKIGSCLPTKLVRPLKTFTVRCSKVFSSKILKVKVDSQMVVNVINFTDFFSVLV